MKTVTVRALAETTTQGPPIVLFNDTTWRTPLYEEWIDRRFTSWCAALIERATAQGLIVVTVAGELPDKPETRNRLSTERDLIEWLAK